MRSIVALSLDGFGTGYSSLAHLRRFPVDAIKVDRAFVQDITAADEDASLTRAVITLAHQLRLKVVAVGVEREHLDVKGALPANAVDLLLVTTHASLAWDDWMKVLDLEGTLCLIGVPSKPLTLGVDPLLDEQKKVIGSVIGSPATMRKMLSVAAEHHISPITESMPLARANDAVSRVREGRARMRVVLDVA